MIIIKGYATVFKKIDANKPAVLTIVKNTYEEAKIEQKCRHAFASADDIEIKEVEIIIK